MIVGGLSKGADRASLIRFLSGTKQIKKVLCLGNQIKDFSCYESYASLDHLVRAIMHIAAPGDQVLFSPSGASFDLFDNYLHRGAAFKKEIYEAKKYFAP